MNKITPIGTAAKALGVSTSALRRWEASGRLVPIRTAGNQRRYDLAALRPELHHGAQAFHRTIACARVLRHDQKVDLERQKQVLKLYRGNCTASQGWTFEVITNPGSGMNYRKQGLRHLLNGILDGNVERLVLIHKDRLLRFGAELVFALCQARQVEVVIINQGDDAGFEEELANDVREIITVFSARLYGSRSHRNQKLIDDVRQAVKEAQ